MQAIVLEGFGGVENLKLADVPKPTTDPKIVVVRASAASINPIDISVRKGNPFSPDPPAVVGCDVAGTIVEVGHQVKDFVPGDEVFGCVGGVKGMGGTFAQYVAVDPDLLARKPKSLSMRQAAALPLVSITSWEAMKRTALTRNEHILVHGGTGGVGHVAVQLAAALGAQVSTTVSSNKDHDVAKRFGAHSTVNYKVEDVDSYVKRLTGGEGFDVIFDTIGGAHLAESFRAARATGRLATTMSLIEMDLRPMHMKALSLHVIFMLLPMLTGRNRKKHGAILGEIAALADEGKVVPLLDESRFDLAHVPEAQAHVEGGLARGKVIIDIG
jgi:NADPH2:quinone reductase